MPLRWIRRFKALWLFLVSFRYSSNTLRVAASASLPTTMSLKISSVSGVMPANSLKDCWLIVPWVITAPGKAWAIWILARLASFMVSYMPKYCRLPS
ncbi:MAG: hypothetical protein GAK34_02856 [Delftia tsuruhatensis]|nr:MAG: hypothetical protein GAK34_02856 [Delftia tsuruhatensis]